MDDDRRTFTDLEAGRDLLALTDPLELVRAITTYYADEDRANRTPRSIIYLHVGMLTGLVLRLTNDRR